MIKLRKAGYCNLKLLLIYLVVYGHWIEANPATSMAALIQYRLIYFIHMPLFAYLSGLFLRNKDDCSKQIKHLLPLYIVLQTIISLISGGNVKLFTPWWTLWYLLSYCMWAGVGWLWFRFAKGKWKLLLLLLSVIVGILAGFVPWLGRTLSASRTVVFLPYFLAGLICDSNFKWQKCRGFGIVGLIIGISAIILWGHRIPTDFLYHANPYGAIENGWLLRLICYFISSTLGLFLLTVIPNRRFPFTKVGADTMPVYLIHGPVVAVFREINTHWALCALFSALLIYIIYKTFQWSSPLYGIISEERRVGACPVFKKSTNSTQERYSDFFCP